jgi:ADP-ribosylglycohydrolase
MFFGVTGISFALACVASPSWILQTFWPLAIFLDPMGIYLAYEFISWLFGRSTSTIDSSPGDPLLERALSGSLLGLAVGDALGLAGEGLSRKRIAKMFPDLTRYHFLPGRGMCSDDTEHACMTVQAWIACRGTTEELKGRSFASILGWKLRFWLLGLPAGVGLATGRGIIKLLLGWSPQRAGIMSAGNGAAMRAPVLGVLSGADSESLRKFVTASTLLTHRDPRALDGALIVARAAYLSSTLTEISPHATMKLLLSVLLDSNSEIAKQVAAAGESVARGESTMAFAEAIGCAKGVTGYVLHTVPVAIHCWLSHPDNIEAALPAVIACGGDTDTVAAIVGGIIGARVGPEGIPDRWKDTLVEWPRTVSWLTRLAQRAAGAAPNKYFISLPVNIPGLLLRNVLFFVIVLLHGFRRLLPPY